jgi:hypothetical protein
MAKMNGERVFRSFRNAPRGLLGMVVLVALGESAVSRHDVDVTNICPANWKFSERHARKTTPGMILCLGTSLVKYGVVSRVIEQETGRPAFNLALCNGHMPSSYYLLKRALESGGKPAAVILDCMDTPEPRDPPPARAETITVNFRQWPELLTCPEWIDLAWSARDPRFLAEMVISRVLPSYKARFEIRFCVRRAAEGEAASSRSAIVSMKRNWSFNRGTQVMPRRRDHSPADASTAAAVEAELLADLPPGRYQVNRLCVTYTRRILSLAESNGIPVFWLLPPLSPVEQLGKDRSGITAYKNREVLKVLEGFPNVTVIDGRRSGYRADLFHDKVHLDRLGASVFSADVGDVVARVLAGRRDGPSWVTLPRYRERPVGVALEDIHESMSIALGVDIRTLR